MKKLSWKQHWKNLLALQTNSTHKHSQLGSQTTEPFSAWKYFRSPPAEIYTRNLQSTQVFCIALKAERIFFCLLLSSRWSGDVMQKPGHKNFNAVSHNRSRPKVLFFNLTWRWRGQISSVLLQLLLFAFSNRKFGRHGKWSVTFWQWENNT